MALEIERKFLVTGDDWRHQAEGVRMAQGYLSVDAGRTVRVRLAGNEAWVTIKGPTQGITRAEFEYPIPTDDAHGLLGLCLPAVIDKTRHRVAFGAHVWEIDVFHGANEGLILAEVELADESVAPELPPWVGVEVSGDPRYCNSSLSSRPFQEFDR